MCNKSAPNHLPYLCPSINPAYANLKIPKPKYVYPKRQQVWNDKGIYDGMRDPRFDDEMVSNTMDHESEREVINRMDADAGGDVHVPLDTIPPPPTSKSYASVVANKVNPNLPRSSNGSNKRAALNPSQDSSVSSHSSSFLGSVNPPSLLLSRLYPLPLSISPLGMPIPSICPLPPILILIIQARGRWLINPNRRVIRRFLIIIKR